jgi:hypothetical protein
MGGGVGKSRHVIEPASPRAPRERGPVSRAAVIKPSR